MAKRSYEQACPIARSLDVVGERWTLLLVRELLPGPRRFKELDELLPKLGPNRLAGRLKSLEAAGVVERRMLAAPASVPVYELTPYGHGLRPALTSLAAWGSALPRDEQSGPAVNRGQALASELASAAPSRLTRGVRETYDFVVGEERFHVTIDDGDVTTVLGPAPGTPDLVLECDLETFIALAAGTVTPSDAEQDGRARLHGPDASLSRAFDILSTNRRTATAKTQAA